MRLMQFIIKFNEIEKLKDAVAKCGREASNSLSRETKIISSNDIDQLMDVTHEEREREMRCIKLQLNETEKARQQSEVRCREAEQEMKHMRVDMITLASQLQSFECSSKDKIQDQTVLVQVSELELQLRLKDEQILMIRIACG